MEMGVSVQKVFFIEFQLKSIMVLLVARGRNQNLRIHIEIDSVES